MRNAKIFIHLFIYLFFSSLDHVHDIEQVKFTVTKSIIRIKNSNNENNNTVNNINNKRIVIIVVKTRSRRI